MLQVAAAQHAVQLLEQLGNARNDGHDPVAEHHTSNSHQHDACVLQYKGHQAAAANKFP